MTGNFEATEPVDPSRKRGCGSRIGATLFGLVFFSAGMLFLVLIGQMVWQIIDSYSWSSQNCSIQVQQVEETSDAEDPYVVRVQYSYSFEGQSYRNSRISFNQRSFDSLIAAEKFAAQYVPGGVVECLVNPEKPTEVVLERDSLWLALLLLLPIIFIVVGAAIALGSWIGGPSVRTETGPSSRGISVKKNSVFVSYIADFFLIVMVLLGAFLTYYLGVRTVQEVYEAERWPMVEGAVLSSRIIESESDDSTTYKAYVAYSYFVDGKEFRNDRYSFMESSSSCYRCAKRIVQAHRKSSPIMVHYDPANPGRSVISPKFRWSYLLGFLPFIFTIVGLLILFRKRRPTTPDSSFGSTDITHSAREKNAALVGSQSNPGMYEVSAEHSSSAKLIAILFFTALWNGILALVLLQEDFFFGWHIFSIFQILFFIPFILVGLLCVAFSLYLFAALWSPSIIILIPSNSISPGNRYACIWKTKGPYERIADLVVTLKAQEKIIYGSGDDRSSKERIVFSQEVFRDTGGNLRANGNFELAVPEGVMHSLDSQYTKLAWFLKVEARVRGLPDVREQMSIVMGPENESR